MRSPGGACRFSGAIMAAAMLLAGCTTGISPQPDERLYPVPAVFDAIRVLAPPPSDAAAQAHDIEAVRAAERHRSAEQSAQAEASSTVDVFLFSSVLGPAFARERLPRTDAFFGRAYRSTLPYLQAAKDCWNRDRPFVADPSLKPLERSYASTRLRSAPASVQAASSPRGDSRCTTPAGPPLYSPSYPSGHATVGALMAILLADMVPERRTELFAKGWQFGEARIISGVHFPTDVEAGRILGSVLAELMQQDAQFRVDQGVARRELRAALGLK